MEETSSTKKGFRSIGFMILGMSIMIFLLLGMTIFFENRKEKSNNKTNNYKELKEKTEISDNKIEENPSNDNQNIEKENSKNDDPIIYNNQNIEKVITSTGVPVTDTFAIQLQRLNSQENALLYYFTLIDGKVYETKSYLKIDENSLTYYNTGFPMETLADETKEAYRNIGINSLKEIAPLPRIKRIKGIIPLGTGVGLEGLLLVAENGEVYIYHFNEYQNEKITKAQFLENYKVEDIIGYYAIPGCAIDDIEESNFKTCGGEYNILDKDGTTHHYIVNKDGTLTKK